MNRLLILFLLLSASVTSVFSQVQVRGYYRKNGTYVQPHQRTYPNHTITDNYSYPGNYNPNTGRVSGGSGAVQSSTYSTPVPVEHKVSAPYYSLPVPSKNLGRESDSYQTSDSASPSDPIVKPVSQATMYALVEENAALKTQPKYMAVSKYAIPKNSAVRVTQYNEDYYLAEVDGRSGYVCTCQVVKTFTRP